LTAEAVMIHKGSASTGALMKLPRTAAEVLGNHVVLELECIDRMYLNVYVPGLQRDLGVVSFFRYHRGLPYASGALMAPMTEAFAAKMQAFTEKHSIPVVMFQKGQRKDDVAKEYRDRYTETEGVYLLGKAQEKSRVWRTESRRNPETGARYPWLVWSTAMVNQYYLYAVDRDFGPFFLKFCSYFPYTAKLCLNGHEYLKRQLANRGIEYEALDNGIADCAKVEVAQAIADDLSAERIEALLRKWLGRLPHPFTRKDRQAGYRYEVSIIQAEFSLTQVLDRPLSGRALFEDIIRQNLDLGRPDQVHLIFDRRILPRTPSRFRTRVITEGVTPSLHIDYKRSRIKQYHKEGRALRTETTINNPRDFDVGKRLKNLPLLREIGFKANRRLLDVETCDRDCILGETAFQQLQAPLVVGTQRVSALRFGERRTLAALGALALFHLHAVDFRNSDLRLRLAQLLELPLDAISSGRMSYELRRLRLRGLIERIPRTHRYRVTPLGRRLATYLTRLYAHLFTPALADLAEAGHFVGPLRAALDNLDRLVADQARGLAA
jgi:hypothetical protein